MKRYIIVIVIVVLAEILFHILSTHIHKDKPVRHLPRTTNNLSHKNS